MTKFSIFLVFACCLQAQIDSVSINGVQLRIGMSKSDVLASLSERNDLVKVKGVADAWCVRPKGNNGTQLGCGDFIQFDQDQLSVASKTLGSASDDDTAVMMSSLFSTLDGLAKSGRTTLSFTTKEVETDDHMRMRILTIMAGWKQYTFIIQQPVGSQSARNSSVELTESFALPAK